MPISNIRWTEFCNPRSNFPDEQSPGSIGTFVFLSRYTSGDKLDVLMKFNIASAIGTGKKITSATIELGNTYKDNTMSPGTGRRSRLQLSSITENWNNTATWNTKPNYGTVEVIAPVSNISTEVTSRSIDITEVVKASYSVNDYGVAMTQNQDGTITQLGATFTPDATYPRLVVTYENPPPAPVVTSPVDGFKFDATKELTVKWSSATHLNNRIKWNNGTDHIITVPGGVNEYTIAGGVMSGVCSVSVSEETTFGWGDYSTPITVTALTKPVGPTVTLTEITEQYPTVTWNSETSEAWNVRISDASGVVYDRTEYNNNKSIKLTTALLDDVQYTISIRIKAGLWSEFSSLSLTSSFPKPSKPSVVSTNHGSYISLQITTSGSISYYEVMKVIDGKNTTILSFTETSKDVHELISGVQETLLVRAYNAVGGFNDSDTFTETTNVDNTVIVKGSTIYALKNTPNKTINKIADVSKVVFAGRKQPVAFVGDSDYTEPSFDFEVFKREDAEALNDIIGEKVLMKDNRGYCKYVVIGGIDETYNNQSYTIGLVNTFEVAR